MDRRRATAWVLGGGIAATALPRLMASPHLSPDAQDPSTLAGHARARGLEFGCMVLREEITSPSRLRDVIAREASMIVPGVEMKWGQTEAREGKPDYVAALDILRFAAAHALRVRGHAGFWYRNIPEWARARLGGPGGERVALARVDRVTRRFKGQIVEWDVVNEVIEPKDGQPGMMRKSPFGRPTSIAFVADCFHAARAADGKALLYYNDYDLECDTPDHENRRQGVLALLRALKERGAPIDGFGTQSHLTLGRPFAATKYRRFLKDIADLGLTIRVTEMDIDDHHALPLISDADQRSADYVRAFLDVCLDEKAVRGVMTWGMTDKNSWLRNESWARKIGGEPVRPLPYDDALARKPMWKAMAQAFDAAPRRSLAG